MNTFARKNDINYAFDFLEMEYDLEPKHKTIKDQVESFVNLEVKPHINHWYDKKIFPLELVAKIGSEGLLGSFVPIKYGGRGFDSISYGLLMQELEKGDSAIRTTVCVQDCMLILPILNFGSEKQKERYLSKLISGSFLGAFGLTERLHGSNPRGMETRAKKVGDNYILNGEKMWITHAPVADIFIILAKTDEEDIQAFIIEKGTEGLTIENIEKSALQASITGTIKLENVIISVEQKLNLPNGINDIYECLFAARYSISWGALGAAIDCYEIALRYTLERHQFGKPLASKQAVQSKLVEMLSKITKAQLLCYKLANLREKGRINPSHVSMGKRDNVRCALDVSDISRELLGANGISINYSPIRHNNNFKAVHTYEGTDIIHTLVMGREITGISAFR